MAASARSWLHCDKAPPRRAAAGRASGAELSVFASASLAAASASSSCASTRSSPLSQKPGSARSMPTICAELLGAARAAGAQQLEVAGHERLALVDVALVDRQRQQLAVRVGVDVARRRDEVRHVGPPRAVALGERDAVAEHLDLRLRPQLVEALDRQLALRRGARCGRATRTGSSPSGGRPSRSSPRSTRRAATGATRASWPARAGGRRRASRRTPTPSRRASAACPARARRAGGRARRAGRGPSRGRGRARRGAWPCS